MKMTAITAAVKAVCRGEKSKARAKRRKSSRKNKGESSPPVEKIKRRVMVERIKADSKSIKGAFCLDTRRAAK